MTDNLHIKGISDEEPPARRGKKSRGRKGFVLQTRWVKGTDHQKGCLDFLFKSLEKWHLHSRYHTKLARDQACAALVKKAKVCHLLGWRHQEYRVQ